MRLQQVVWPDFYPAFSCTGTGCSDNCCHDWPVDLDRDTYLSYARLPQPELAELSRKMITQTGGTKEHFARIRLGSDGRCPFQDPDGGCKLVRGPGPDALGLICTLYPRRKTEFVPGSWELSLSMSCEEAVRLGVLTPDRVRFQAAAIAPEGALAKLQPVGIGPGGAVMAPPEYGQTLRQGILALMGRRDLPVRLRLLAITLLLDRITPENLEKESILGLIAAFTRIDGKDLAALLSRLSMPREAVLEAWKIPISHVLAGRSGPLREKLLDVLPKKTTLDRQGAAACLTRIQQRGDPLLEAHSREVENYFINHLFSALFPFMGNPSDFFYPAAALAEQYALLRLLASLSERPTESGVLTEAIVHLSRLIQHTDHCADLRSLARQLGLDLRVLRPCFLVPVTLTE